MAEHNETVAVGILLILLLHPGSMHASCVTSISHPQSRGGLLSGDELHGWFFVALPR